GAAVWSDGALIDVVSQHNADHGSNSFDVTRIDHLYRLTDDSATTLRHLMGLPAQADLLRDVVAGHSPRRHAGALWLFGRPPIAPTYLLLRADEMAAVDAAATA